MVSGGLGRAVEPIFENARGAKLAQEFAEMMMRPQAQELAIAAIPTAGALAYTAFSDAPWYEKAMLLGGTAAGTGGMLYANRGARRLLVDELLDSDYARKGFNDLGEVFDSSVKRQQYAQGLGLSPDTTPEVLKEKTFNFLRKNDDIADGWMPSVVDEFDYGRAGIIGGAAVGTPTLLLNMLLPNGNKAEDQLLAEALAYQQMQQQGGYV